MPASPYYHQALNFEELCKEYPPAREYEQTTHLLSRDEIRSIQERRFIKQIERAWQIPFYQRHWSKAGMEAGDVRSLDDLKNIPPYSVYDVREAIERHPPFGDQVGLDLSGGGAPLPLVLQTSGGTTGLPRPMIYTPQDRETMNILSSRRLWMQGVRPFDRVQVALTLGLSNGGLLGREALWKYTGAIPVMTASGAVTPTRQQVEIMRAWGVNVLIAFPAYLRHIGRVAREELGIDPRSLGLKSVLSHLGVDDRKQLEDLWGAPVYDCYGTNECGAIAADCTERNGMHVYEDAFVVEVADKESMKPCEPGAHGTAFLTTLFKYAAPVIRYDSGDITAIMPGKCACGSNHVRLQNIFGRNDGMIKLRGVNVYPEAVGALICADNRSTGEFVCIVEHVGVDNRDEMTVLAEVSDPETQAASFKHDLEQRLREALSVKIAVKPVAKGETDEFTGLSKTSKIKRVVDRRKKA